MNIEFNNATENEVEYAEKNNYSTSAKYKKYELLILLGCLVLAFLVWCYANYLDDPIIQKNVDLVVYLNDGNPGDEIFYYKKVTVYGEESLISTISEIQIEVDRDKFKDSNSEITVDIDYPTNVHSHQKTVTVKLVNDDKTTDQ